MVICYRFRSDAVSIDTLQLDRQHKRYYYGYMTTAAAVPVRAQRSKVVHYTGPRVTRIAWQVKITLADGSPVYCDHEHGHRTDEALLACSTRLVAKLNRAAGTTSAEVERRNREKASA